ncbi:MAG: hypothetical protein ACPGWR_31815 [Ardenticatenaceae bacterium]
MEKKNCGLRIADCGLRNRRIADRGATANRLRIADRGATANRLRIADSPRGHPLPRKLSRTIAD